MMQSVQLFRHALEQWESRKPEGRLELYAFARELEALCMTGTNLYVVDMQPDDPLSFGNDTWVQNVDLKGSTATLGSYPDQDYVKQDVAPFYLGVKENNEANWLRMKSIIQGHGAIYDRLILPIKEDRKVRWGLSITKTRVLIPPKPSVRSLTDRQQDILFLLSQGESSKDIALRMRISHRTVEHQIAAIRQKLGARNTTEAVAIFMGKSLIG